MRRWFIAGCFGLGLTAGVVSAVPVGAQAWIQWKSAEGGNNHYYSLTPTATNWDAAQKVATSWGGTLATITSSNEQDFINTAFLNGKFEHLPLWIGLRKASSSGGISGNVGALHVQIGLQPNADFHWVTGEALCYTNWKSGEPSDTPPGEDYVAINWAYSDLPPRGVKGDWNDTPLNGTTGYGGKTDGPYFGLVERDTDPIQPATRRVKKSVVYLGLLTVLVIGLIMTFGRSKRHKPSVA